MTDSFDNIAVQIIPITGRQDIYCPTCHHSVTAHVKIDKIRRIVTYIAEVRCIDCQSKWSQRLTVDKSKLKGLLKRG
jgi:hypothetical protein